MGISHEEFLSPSVYLRRVFRRLLLHNICFAYGVQKRRASPVVGTSLISFENRLITYIV